MNSFRSWFQERFKAARQETPGLKLTQVCEEAGVDYIGTWKAVQGDPSKYRDHQKLSDATIIALGHYFGDLDGALAAGGVNLPGAMARRIAEDDGAESDLRVVVSSWSKIPKSLRRAIREMAVAATMCATEASLPS